jgi:hypothetical protein
VRSSRNRYAALFVCAGLLAVAVVPIALGSTDVRGATNPILNRLVLKGPQVGAGYKLVQRPDGHGARGYVTLDMCGFVFPSEDLRTDRLQVNYKRAGTAVELSNEVVSYRPGGAAQALHEIGGAAAQCPKGPVRSNVKGLSALTYRLTRLHSSGLLPGYVAFRAHVSGKYQGKAFEDTSVIVYQLHGNILSAVYGHGGTLASRTKTTLVAARASARNLSS